MTDKDRQLLQQTQARLAATGELLAHLATFLQGAQMVDHAGRTAFIIADTDAWERLNAAVAEASA